MRKILKQRKGKKKVKQFLDTKERYLVEVEDKRSIKGKKFG